MANHYCNDFCTIFILFYFRNANRKLKPCNFPMFVFNRTRPEGEHVHLSPWAHLNHCWEGASATTPCGYHIYFLRLSFVLISITFWMYFIRCSSFFRSFPSLNDAYAGQKSKWLWDSIEDWHESHSQSSLSYLEEKLNFTSIIFDLILNLVLAL